MPIFIKTKCVIVNDEVLLGILKVRRYALKAEIILDSIRKIEICIFLLNFGLSGVLNSELSLLYWCCFGKTTIARMRVGFGYYILWIL